MTDTKFTPGPWKVETLTNGKTYVGIMKANIESMAQIVCSLDTGEHKVNSSNIRDKANAHLIAAAPDLYEALEMVVFELHAGDDSLYSMYADLTGDQVQAICAALAKARGEQ